MKCKTLILLLLIFFLLISNACGNNDSNNPNHTNNSNTNDKTTLVFYSYLSGEDAERAMIQVVELFMKQNPNIKVELSTFPHEDFKTLIKKWLPSEISAPDVATWKFGESMREFARDGLLEPLDSIFENEAYDANLLASTESTGKYNGKIYNVMFILDFWAIFYLKSTFEKYNLTPPKTWNELIEVSEKLKSNGITPFAIGTKNKWTSYVWVDYIDMRLNGYEFHQDLVQGRVEWTDPRIRNVFEYWKVLIENDYFIDNHTSYSWQEAATMVYNGEAGMCALGSFFPSGTNDIEKRADIDFFRFPSIEDGVPMSLTGENAPGDGLIIPANAKNKEAAKKFIKFFTTKEAQQLFFDILKRSIPTNKFLDAPDSTGQKGLDNIIRPATFTQQAYDIEVNSEMASRSLNSFVDFMNNPNQIDKILEEIEKERQKIYKGIN